jgi:hypothetical protein
MSIWIKSFKIEYGEQEQDWRECLVLRRTARRRIKPCPRANNVMAGFKSTLSSIGQIHFG